MNVSSRRKYKVIQWATGSVGATAFRIVNRIPDVCEAPAGILSPLDLDLQANPGLVRR